jgi:hypothetical protein
LRSLPRSAVRRWIPRPLHRPGRQQAVLRQRRTARRAYQTSPKDPTRAARARRRAANLCHSRRPELGCWDHGRIRRYRRSVFCHARYLLPLQARTESRERWKLCVLSPQKRSQGARLVAELVAGAGSATPSVPPGQES